eukprot:54472-Rhodomonas_salina.3
MSELGIAQRGREKIEEFTRPTTHTCEDFSLSFEPGPYSRSMPANRAWYQRALVRTERCRND